MRVLYDISAIGLGHISVHARAGGYRVDRHLTELLGASQDCDLVLCANHSSLAYEGCVEFLRGRSSLAHVPLIRQDESWMARGLRTAIASAHRHVKISRGGRALPQVMRASGTLVSARVHPPVLDATPPVDIHHSSTTPLPSRRRGRSPARFVTIHDLRASRFDGTPPEIAYENAMLASVGAGDWVMTSSESTRREVCDRGVVEPDRIAVAPLAADPTIFRACEGDDDADAVGRRYGIQPGPYILMLKGVTPRKNILRAVTAFADLVGQERARDLQLVLVGGHARRADPVAALVDRLPALRGRVRSLGYVTDEDLASLYRSALAFVYPSLYEGFGLPPLEAMQCGTPVITASTSSLPEVVGDAGITVDPHDTDAFAASMLALYRDAALRESLRRKGLTRAALFSWERTLACTMAAYRAALAA